MLNRNFITSMQCILNYLLMLTWPRIVQSEAFYDKLSFNGHFVIFGLCPDVN